FKGIRKNPLASINFLRLVKLNFFVKIENKISSFASMIIDTHTHLYSPAFDEDRDLIVSRALEAGVKEFYIPAIDSGYTDSMYRLEQDYPGKMFLMMGLHPTSVKENYEEELLHVER